MHQWSSGSVSRVGSIVGVSSTLAPGDAAECDAFGRNEAGVSTEGSMADVSVCDACAAQGAGPGVGIYAWHAPRQCAALA